MLNGLYEDEKEHVEVVDESKRSMTMSLKSRRLPKPKADIDQFGVQPPPT